jgi:branched-chain amino acid transport system permease protein
MSRRLRIVDAVWPVAVLALAVVVVVAVLGNGSNAVITDLIQALVTLTVAIGLYVFIGNSGVVSLGHAAFMGVGAYIGGIASIPLIQRGVLLPYLPDWATSTALGLWPAALLAAVVTAAVGFVVSIPLSRLNGLAAAVATLALLQVAQVVMLNWKVVAGDGGATPGVPIDTTTWDAVFAVIIALVVAYLFQRSPSGIRLRASREDAVAAESVGVRIARERRWAFTLSAGIAGLGGALYAHSLGTITPSDFFILTGFLQLAMLVVGGIRSMAGAVVGVAAVSIVTDVLERFQNGDGIGPVSFTIPNGINTVVVALLVLLILIKRPSGITGGRELRPPARLRRALGAPPPPALPVDDPAAAVPAQETPVADLSLNAQVLSQTRRDPR